MAYCPNCNAVMGVADTACAECGYDFPLDRHDSGEPFAYSRVANVALLMGACAAGVGCVVVVIASIVALVRGDWCGALVVGPVIFLVLLGILVLFLRVLDLKPRR